MKTPKILRVPPGAEGRDLPNAKPQRPFRNYPTWSGVDPKIMGRSGGLSGGRRRAAEEKRRARGEPEP